MNLPTVFLDMSWFVTVITPGSSLSLSTIIVAVWITSSSKGRSFHCKSWVLRSHHYFLSTSCLTSENASLRFGRGLAPIILPLTSSGFLLSPRRNLKVRFCSKILLYRIVSSGQFQLWISNIYRCCQWQQRVLKYWVIERSPRRRSCNTASISNSSDVFSELE